MKFTLKEILKKTREVVSGNEYLAQKTYCDKNGCNCTVGAIVVANELLNGRKVKPGELFIDKLSNAHEDYKTNILPAMKAVYRELTDEDCHDGFLAAELFDLNDRKLNKHSLIETLDGIIGKL